MKRKSKLLIAIATAVLAVLGGKAVYAQDKYSLKSPSGIAFSDESGKNLGLQAASGVIVVPNRPSRTAART